MSFAVSDPAWSFTPPRLFLSPEEGGSFLEGLLQIGRIALLLSPFIAVGALWIVTLKRKVALQTSVLRDELDRLERAEREVARLNIELRRTQKEIAFTLGEVIESRSRETANHVRRVAAMSEYMAAMIGMSVEDSRRVGLASSMHDIGKIGVPDSVLNKPGKLTSDEFEIVKTHSTIGYEILSRAGGDLFDLAALIAHEHHERWDGGGYPRGIGGESIALEARIVAVVDVFDALSHDRVYKKAWDMDRVLDFLGEERGAQFDPQVVDVFLENSMALIDISLSMPDENRCDLFYLYDNMDVRGKDEMIDVSLSLSEA